MDALQEARDLFARTQDIVDRNENLDPFVSAQLAQAAAMIAQAEAARPQYVQIGDIAFNPANIARVAFTANEEGDGPAAVITGRDLFIVFTGADYSAFLRWWNEHADVVRLDTED